MICLDFFHRNTKLTLTSFCKKEILAEFSILMKVDFRYLKQMENSRILPQEVPKMLYRIALDSREEAIVLVCASADGGFCKPYVLFPGVRPTFNLQDVNPDDYDLGASTNGWMSAECFFGWLANLFYPRVVNKVPFPILVFMDGHTSHINVAVSEFCREKNIILFCFPSHASHLIQPLDVSVYGPLKKYWNDSLNSFSKKYKGLSMSRTHFFPTFESAWKKAVDTPENVRSGFRKCGLVPFNPDAVPYDRLIRPQEDMSGRTVQTDDREKIGMMRMYQLYQDCLTPDLITPFR